MSGAPQDPLGDLIEAQRPALPPVRRALYLAGGIVCMILGVVGWLVPIVTGVPFYILGFALLGLASPRAARWVNALDRRLPLRARLALRRRRSS
ncbi:MAG: hypothetical protein IT454_19405 [Planctomycetes bacterium]|nr:hypothetical protein [Planctomycetota bacterium]